MGNGLVAIHVHDRNGRPAKDFLARVNGRLESIATAFVPQFDLHPEGNRFFDTTVTQHRYAVHELSGTFRIGSHDDTCAVVELVLGGAGIQLVERISLRSGESWFHVDVEATLAEPLIDYLVSSIEFDSNTLDFVHSPTVKCDDPRSGLAADQVIGDHAFHSPAVILQSQRRFAAIVPDLDTINSAAVVSQDARRTMKVERGKFSVPIVDEKYTIPTALDLNVASGLTDKPIFSYGIMDFIVAHHMRFQRANDESMVRSLASPQVHYAFDLFIGGEEPRGEAYRRVSRHLWQSYGSSCLRNPHLAMPFEEYVRTIYAVVSRPMDPEVQAPVPGFQDNGVFLDFDLEGVAVGGMVSPLGALGYGDALWNFEFWNGLRDAKGMFYWGRVLGESTLVDRAKRIVNLALLAPQGRYGFFPTIFFAGTRSWSPSSIGPAPEPESIFAKESVVHDVPAMSKCAAHLLEYYESCEHDDRIIAYLVRYADGLLELLEADDVLPSYYTTDMQPSPSLIRSAQPAASMWILAKLGRITGEVRFIRGASRIADYLMREIIPEQLWIDLEPYYSCGRNPLSFTRDSVQDLPVRGNLSTLWAAYGFSELYRGTGREEYLRTGEAVVDYLGFSQACWAPHYVYTAYPFGGMTADNVDTVNWLDARQCEAVAIYAWYGMTLGRQDLIERAVAAARSSVVLINHPRHKKNEIYRYTNWYGYALGPENINHEGHNQSPMRTHPSWGECSGIFTGLADARSLLGDVYVDIGMKIAVGVNGVSVDAFAYSSGRIDLTVTNRLINLTEPWSEMLRLCAKIVGLEADRTYELVVNGKSVTMVSNRSANEVEFDL